MDVIDAIIQFIPIATGAHYTDYKCFHARRLAERFYAEQGDSEMVKKLKASTYSAKIIYARMNENNNNDSNERGSIKDMPPESK